MRDATGGVIGLGGEVGRRRFASGAAPTVRTRSVTFVVAGDVPALVEGVRRWIEGARSGWRVVDTCSRLSDLDQVTAIRTPDVVIVARVGDERCPDLRSLCCGRVVMMTQHVDPVAELDLLRRGADAVVPVDARRDEVLDAVDSLLAGRSPVTLEAMRLAVDGPVEDASTTLTRRQAEVLELFAAGYSNRQIASQLTLSVNTVKAHLRQIAQRVGMSGQRMLAVHALRLLGREPEVSGGWTSKLHPWGDGGPVEGGATLGRGLPHPAPKTTSEGTDD